MMPNNDKPYHVPVMLTETVDALNVVKGGLYLDGTLGGGGHSSEILRRGGRLIGFDRDTQAITHCQNTFASLGEFSGRYTLIHTNFFSASQIIREYLSHIDCLEGAVLDLGISSRQVDENARGFSYIGDAAIDMRMDTTEKFSAYHIINEYSEQQLLKILYSYGEEKNAKKIVRAILKAREAAPIATTKALSDLVIKCFPPYIKGGHPAKRTFQALRIEVNGELDGLGQALLDIIGLLKPGARLAVITFHSLEDRIVKRTFKDASEVCRCDKSIPVCVCKHKPLVKQIGKGIRPSDTELAQNSRAKSATLRIVEKL